jgi:hypothetical protein
VRSQLVVARTHDAQHAARSRGGRRLVRDTDVDLGDLAENQRGLAAGHRQINVEQNLCVKQRAVQLAMRVVDVVALAQCIEAVALAGMHLPRQRQRVDDRAEAAHLAGGTRQALQLCVEEGDIERRVVNHQLRAAQELDQLVDHFGELGLRRQKLVGDAVHVLRGAIDQPVGPQVAVEFAARLTAIDQLDAADLDDAVSLLRLQPRGFGVEDDLAHDRLRPPRATLARRALAELRSGTDASAG